MLGKLRFVAPMVGACLMAVPVSAQTLGMGQAAPAESLSAAETVWHMRAALNVAALACRGAEGEDTVRLYNAMLHDAAAPLAEAAAGTEQAYRKRFAAQWQDAEDGAMTRLYNGFAVQNGHEAFCATAHTVLRGISSIEPSDFANFAAAALVRLEAPFTAAAPAPIVEAIEVHTAPPLQVALLTTGGGDTAPRRMTIAFAD
eukprot:gene31663-36264_t